MILFSISETSTKKIWIFVSSSLNSIILFSNSFTLGYNTQTSFALYFFEYLIVFKKKFGLINDFEARKKVGSQTDADAIRVGKIVLTLGAGLLVLFVLLMIFT